VSVYGNASTKRDDYSGHDYGAERRGRVK